MRGRDISGRQHWSLVPENSTGYLLNGPTAVLTLVSNRLDGRDVPLTTGNSEVRLIIYRLLVALSEAGRFRLVTTHPEEVPAGSTVTNFQIHFDERQDLHLVEAATKGFVTGFFTLGLFGHIFPNNYDFETNLKVLVVRTEGTSRVFESSAKGGVESDVNKAGEGAVAGRSLREKLRWSSIEKFLSDFKTSGL